MANFFDQFDSDQGQAAPPPTAPASGHEPLRLTIHPNPQTNFFDQFDAPTMSATDVATDVAKSLGIGGVQAGLGIAGIPGDVLGAGNAATGAFLQALAPYSDFAKRVLEHHAQRPEAVNPLPTYESLTKRVEDLAGSPLYQPKTTLGEYARTAGEFLPAVVAGPESLAARLAQRVAVPAIGAETAGQATKGTSAEPWARLFGGLAAARFAAPAAAKVISPVTPNANLQPFVDTLRAEGVPLTAGEATGSKALRYFENELGDALGAGGKATAANTATLEQFTRAALARAGENATRATPDVIDRAFGRIGNAFESIGRRNYAVPDARFAQEVRNTEQDFHRLTGAQSPLLNQMIQRVAEAAGRNNGVLSGQSYNTIRSDLARYARQASDDQLKLGLRDMIHSLDDLMTRYMRNPADAAAFAEARRQYRNLIVLEKAATGAGEATAQGLISPSKLRADAVTQNRRAYARGHGDFADLARAGEALVKPLPQSGTAPRTAARLIPALVAHAVAGPAGGGAMLAGAYGAPAFAGRLIHSRLVQAYLGNQVAAQLRHQNHAMQLLRAGILGSLPAR